SDSPFHQVWGRGLEMRALALKTRGPWQRGEEAGKRSWQNELCQHKALLTKGGALGIARSIMNQVCRIELLGGLRVRQEQRVITRFRTQKAGALLAYLAYYPHPTHPREILLEMLWPDLDPAAGRDNLSTILSSLRHQLEPPETPHGSVLIADRLTVG